MSDESWEQELRGYRFAEFTLSLDGHQLMREGQPVPLQAQPRALLVLLLERPGRLVTREEIYDRLWPPGVNVDAEHGLNTAVRKLRAALGDRAAAPRFIETVPRVGYRFLGHVEAEIRRRDLVPLAPRQAAGDPLPPGGAVFSRAGSAARPLRWILAGFPLTATLVLLGMLIAGGTGDAGPAADGCAGSGDTITADSPRGCPVKGRDRRSGGSDANGDSRTGRRSGLPATG